MSSAERLKNYQSFSRLDWRRHLRTCEKSLSVCVWSECSGTGWVSLFTHYYKLKKIPRLLKLQGLQPLSCETKSWKRLQWFVTEESYLQDGGGARRRGHRTWNRKKKKHVCQWTETSDSCWEIRLCRSTQQVYMNCSNLSEPGSLFTARIYLYKETRLFPLWIRQKGRSVFTVSRRSINDIKTSCSSLSLYFDPEL